MLLNEVEKANLQRFVNSEMYETVKKFFLESPKPLVEYAADRAEKAGFKEFTDAEIGSHMRAYGRNMDYLKKAFAELELYIKVAEIKPNLNEAR